MFLVCLAGPMIENLDATLRQGRVPTRQQMVSPAMPNFSNIQLPSTTTFPQATSKGAGAGGRGVLPASSAQACSVNADMPPNVSPMSVSSASATISKIHNRIVLLSFFIHCDFFGSMVQLWMEQGFCNSCDSRINRCPVQLKLVHPQRGNVVLENQSSLWESEYFVSHLNAQYPFCWSPLFEKK